MQTGKNQSAENRTRAACLTILTIPFALVGIYITSNQFENEKAWVLIKLNLPEVQIGMTQEEVIELLGRPSGNPPSPDADDFILGYYRDHLLSPIGFSCIEVRFEDGEVVEVIEGED